MKKIKSRKKKEQLVNIFKVIIWCFIIGGLIGSIGTVEAGMNDSVMTKNRMDGIYAVAKVDGRDRIFYLNMYRMNGRIAYCIELGKDVTTDIYHSTNDFSVGYLTDEQIEYVRSISYFGYEYFEHDDYRYYMAAQEIIWEYLSGTEVEWTNVLDVNGQRIDIEFYKAKIFEERELFYKLPDFFWTDDATYTIGGMIGLYDYNSVLSNYEVISNTHSSAVINGNNFQIEVATDFIGREEIILKRKNYYDYDGSLYYYDNSQRLISSGNFKEITKKLSFIIEGVTMNVEVVDSQSKKNIPDGQASLEGATYEIYNSSREKIGTYVTDASGNFNIYNLPYGDYYFKQIKASEGYMLNDEEIKISFWQVGSKVILEQKVISNVIELNKVYGSEGKYIPERGILFKVLDSNKLVYSECVTDQDGMVSITLPYGSYTIVQDNTTWGYELIEPFNVVVNEAKNDKIVYNLVNELIRCRINVYTYDSIFRSPISDVSYRIKKKKGNDYLEYDGVSEFKANENGVVEFPLLLDYGDYILEQIDISNNFLIYDDVLEFSINDNTSFLIEDNQLWVNINVINQPIYGKVELIYNEEVFYSELNNYGYSKMPSDDGKFLLVADEGIIFNQNSIYKAGDVIDEFVTDSNGIFSIMNIYLGKYCLINIDDSVESCFELSSNSNKDSIVEKKLQVTKFLNKGDVKIINQDELGNVIGDSIFEVVDSSGQVIFTGVTNDDGIILVKDLVFGDYCIKQKEIDDKYLLIDEESCINFKDNQLVEFINNGKTNKVEVPNTFLDEKFNFGFLIHFVFLVGIGVLVYKKIIINH